MREPPSKAAIQPAASTHATRTSPPAWRELYQSAPFPESRAPAKSRSLMPALLQWLGKNGFRHAFRQGRLFRADPIFRLPALPPVIGGTVNIKILRSPANPFVYARVVSKQIGLLEGRL